MLKNGPVVIGLFHGMFERNILTFNPGWDQDVQPVDPYTDIRDSENQPIVSICQAPLDPCRRLLPASQVIPRPDAPPGVTVVIEAREVGVQMALSDELRRSWTDVDLAAGRPGWLGTR